MKPEPHPGQRKPTAKRPPALRIVAGIFLTIFLWTKSAWADSPPPAPETPAYVPGQLIVRFREGLPPMMMASALLSVRMQTLEVEEALGLQLVAVQPGLEEKLIDLLSANPLIEYAGPTYIAHIAGEPNDPAWWRQWDMRQIGMEAAWDQAKGDNVVIALIDTGVDASHPELAGRLLAGYDFANDDGDPQDDNGHGTHVAGILAAGGNNGIGIAGMAWHAKILPLKVLDAKGDGSYFNIIRAIRYAADHGAKIINLSLGGSFPDPNLQEAVQYARTRGCLVVAAAGNQGGALLYPAAYGETLAVAATDDRQRRPSYSNYGAEVDLAAPGGTQSVGIYSLTPGGGYTTLFGTSMATPHVSGLAALIWSTAPALTADQVAGIIKETALKVGTTPYNAAGWNQELGYGLINAPAALQRAQQFQAPTPAPTPTRPPAATPTPTSAPLRTVTLQLRAGWNLVSFNVQPLDERIPVLTAELGNALEAILSFRCGIGGLSYYTNLPADINSLQSLQGGRGYWMKMREARTWHIAGYPIPADAPISLCAGWNLAGYLPDREISLTSALASLGDRFQIVLGYHDGQARSYYAGLPADLNTLQTLRPGHGYWIYVSQAGILTYPGQ
ncbi:MAG: S8 family peptidase [Anaerolineae bacterium]